MEDSLRVVIICVVCAVVIVALSGYVIDSYLDLRSSEKKEYSIVFDSGDITFQHDESGVTFVIDNINQVGNKPMSISDSTRGNDYSIFASEFSNGGEMVDLDIRFDDQRVGSFRTMADQSKQIDISVNKQFELGRYHGWFILPGFSIPITLSTPPIVLQSILIIIIGALTSIIVIEITKLADFYIQDNLSRSDRIRADPRAAAVVQYKINFYKERYSGITAIIKQSLLSFLPAMFALGLALFAFINNEMVTTVLELNFENVVGLFLLGAGIESIKELFNRPNV